MGKQKKQRSFKFKPNVTINISTDLEAIGFKYCEFGNGLSYMNKQKGLFCTMEYLA